MDGNYVNSQVDDLFAKNEEDTKLVVEFSEC